MLMKLKNRYNTKLKLNWKGVVMYLVIPVARKNEYDFAQRMDTKNLCAKDQIIRVNDLFRQRL